MGSWMSPLLRIPSSQLWLITSRCFLSRRASEEPFEAPRPLWVCFFGGAAQTDAGTQVLPCVRTGKRAADLNACFIVLSAAPDPATYSGFLSDILGMEQMPNIVFPKLWGPLPSSLLWLILFVNLTGLKDTQVTVKHDVWLCL